MRLSTSFERSSSLVLTSTMILALARQASAQLADSNLPDLASVTGASVGGGESTTQTQVATTSVKNTAATTGQTTTAATTKANTNGQDSTMATTAPTIAVTNAPSLTTGTATGTTSFYHLSDIPTIAGAGIPTQVVPWTAGAPFMQKSNLPEGTVFICVGAILGFLGLAILAWRGLVAWSLHRSVQRAAQSSYSRSEKAVLHKQAPSSRPGLYSASSNLSLDQLSRPLNAQKPMTQKEAKHTSNLFFSPTAGAGVHTGGLGTPDRRPASSHLPAGYYASTSAHIPSTTQLNSYNSPSGYGRPQSFAPSHTFQPSPDGSPIMRGIGYAQTANSSVAGAVGSAIDSSSQLNLNVPGGNVAGGRAPSVYLEDLFDNHGNGPRERF